MRVLFLQRQPCIRTLKYAIGLRAARPDLRLDFACQGATLSGWYGAGDELFDHWWPLDVEPAGSGGETRPAGASREAAERLRRVLDEVQPDVIHSHNLPDGLTVTALELTDVPVIHDSHDMQSLRQTPYEDGFPELDDPLVLERRAIEGSAGLITVSDEMLEQIQARYQVPAHSLVFANFAAERDLPTVLPPAGRGRSGPIRVVYQGTLSTNGGHYDLRHLFNGLVSQGVELDIYPSRPSPDYVELAEATPGMQCHESLEPSKLLQELAAYDFGWAGFNDALNGPHLDTVLPNKLFEYLGCGLPVLTLRRHHKALDRFVTQHGVGLVLDSVDDLSARLAEVDVPALRTRVGEVRPLFTVEANIGEVLALYDAVSGTGGARRPAGESG